VASAGIRPRPGSWSAGSSCCGTPDDWRDVARRKLVELDERIAAAQTARHAIAHALACEHQNLRDCPTSARIVDARLAGIPLNEAHAH
jgi:hypothetical protein